MRRHRFDLPSVELTAESLARFDVVVVVTHHDAFDFPLIPGTRAVDRGYTGVYRERVEHIRAGVKLDGFDVPPRL